MLGISCVGDFIDIYFLFLFSFLLGGGGGGTTFELSLFLCLFMKVF